MLTNRLFHVNTFITKQFKHALNKAPCCCNNLLNTALCTTASTRPTCLVAMFHARPQGGRRPTASRWVLHSKQLTNFTNGLAKFPTCNVIFKGENPNFTGIQLRYFTSARPGKKSEVHDESHVESVDKDQQQKTVGLQEMKENIWTIPNCLTMSRIVITPVLGYFVLQESYMLACSLFVFAGITDLLDGWIARRYKDQMSAFGSFLDPLADKLLISTLFATLTIMHLIPLALTALIIARDIGLIGAAFYVRYISLPPPKTLQRFFDATHVTSQMKPLYISKVNTVVQLALVTFTLASPVFSYVDCFAMQCLWYLTASTTVASGIGYMVSKDTFRIYKKAKQNK